MDFPFISSYHVHAVFSTPKFKITLFSIILQKWTQPAESKQLAKSKQKQLAKSKSKQPAKSKQKTKAASKAEAAQKVEVASKVGAASKVEAASKIEAACGACIHNVAHTSYLKPTAQSKVTACGIQLYFLKLAIASKFRADTRIAITFDHTVGFASNLQIYRRVACMCNVAHTSYLKPTAQSKVTACGVQLYILKLAIASKF
jgi:hypothetical protein